MFSTEDQKCKKNSKKKKSLQIITHCISDFLCHNVHIFAVRKHIRGLLPKVLICGLKVIFFRKRSHKNNNKISREIGPDILPPKLMLLWFGRKTKPLFTVDFLCFSFANCSKNHLRESKICNNFFFAKWRKRNSEQCLHGLNPN